MQIVKPPCSKDFRQGADQLHRILDGKIVLPDALCVFLVGVIGALAPFGLLLLWCRGTL